MSVTMNNKQATAAQMQGAAPATRPVMKKDDKWRAWVEVKVRVSGIPIGVTTWDLWHAFSRKGRILRIEIFDKQTARDAEANVIFSPAPQQPFWETINFQLPVKKRDRAFLVQMELQRPQRAFLHRSPVNPKYLHYERTRLFAESLDFGIIFSETSMMVMKTVLATPRDPIILILNLLRRQLEIHFSFVPDSDHISRSGVRRYRLQVPLRKLEHIYDLQLEDGMRALIVPVDIPPEVYCQTDAMQKTHDEQSSVWTEWRTWFRQTHIREDLQRLETSPTKLGRSTATIDIGSWTTYRLVFDKTSEMYRRMLSALRDYNVSTFSEEDMPITLRTREQSHLWSLLDLTQNYHSGPVNDNGGLLEMGRGVRFLPFPIRYQLEVCLSQGYLNEFNISEAFVRKLAALDDQMAINLLERVADVKRRFYDPMEIFEIPTTRASGIRKVPDHCFESRTATVTPTTIYFTTPAVEITNRVVRHFWVHRNQFLRVKFSDEINGGKINSVDDDTQDEVFDRIRRTLRNGIVVGDRKFEFVAFGNSQFREHGALFFASTPELTAATIRDWMGWDEVKEIRNVAKRCARLGQCLSTTRAINTGSLDIEYIADEKSYCGTFCFTDGVGKVSRLVASLIVAQLGLPTAPNDLPSVFQFRLGGAKGVLAIDPNLTGNTMCLRESQWKFDSKHKNLEIIRVSQFAAATTNRQLIILLSNLGVPDGVFRGKLHNQLVELNQAMQDEETAVQLLEKNIDFNQITLTLAGMINDGFMKVKDPFVMSLLQLWRSWSTKYLKEKAKIFLDQGACLLGCVDEAGVLQGHFDVLQPPEMASREVKEETLPEIFVRVDAGRSGKYKVIEGICILCRNPSLHPGDIRVVRAVDKPELYHLKNVVVLPRRGDRDLASMCSGGDLDGDDYLVIWDQDLLPELTHWNSCPMDFTPNAPPQPPQDPTVDDMIDFFVTYMKNDCLPKIAHAHLAWADQLGVWDNKCLKLAKLHSDAVDYSKSGVPARMERFLQPRYWPHFMEKKHKPAEQIYKSESILGQLYDMVKVIDFSPDFDTLFDSRILTAYNPGEDILREASELKEEYDAAIKRIMAQHDIRTEFEVWSTFCLSHNFDKKDWTFAEELGRVVSAVKERFRAICVQKAGGWNFEALAPFVAAMYKVTAEQVRTAVEACEEAEVDGEDEDNPLAAKKNKADDEDEDEDDSPLPTKNKSAMPFMSFPWIFDRELGKIANGMFRPDSVSTAHSMQNGINRHPGTKHDQEGTLNLSKATGAETIGGIQKEMDLHKMINVGMVDEEHIKMVEAGIQGPRTRNILESRQTLRSNGMPSQIKKRNPPGAAMASKVAQQPIKPTNEGDLDEDNASSSDVDLDGDIGQIELDNGATGMDKLVKLVHQET